MTAPEPSHYPVVLDVAGRLAVVVGSGRSAETKARSLASHGADVVLIAPDVSAEMLSAEADGLITIERRGYVRGDLEGAFLVVCASGTSEIDAAVHAEARERGVLMHAASSPVLCNYLVPSVVRRGPLQIAISTEGRVPWLTRRVRREIAERYGPAWAEYAALLARVRTYAIERCTRTEAEIDTILEAIHASDVLERIEGGAVLGAADVFREFKVACDGPTKGEDQ